MNEYLLKIQGILDKDMPDEQRVSLIKHVMKQMPKTDETEKQRYYDKLHDDDLKELFEQLIALRIGCYAAGYPASEARYTSVKAFADHLFTEIDVLRADCVSYEADLKAMKHFADLWYFVMDEKPRSFEKIVNEWASEHWMRKASELMKETRNA